MSSNGQHCGLLDCQAQREEDLNLKDLEIADLKAENEKLKAENDWASKQTQPMIDKAVKSDEGTMKLYRDIHDLIVKVEGLDEEIEKLKEKNKEMRLMLLADSSGWKQLMGENENPLTLIKDLKKEIEDLKKWRKAWERVVDENEKLKAELAETTSDGDDEPRCDYCDRTHDEVMFADNTEDAWNGETGCCKKCEDEDERQSVLSQAQLSK
jgi:hypothetical protein